VVGKRALEAAFLVLRRAEVDDPRVSAVAVKDADRARPRRDVVDVGGEHQRRDQDNRRSGRFVRVVVTQAKHALFGRNLVRRRHLAGLEAAKTRDLEGILGDSSETRRRARDLRRDQPHVADAR
jgi:hypothetical protein